MGESSTSKSPRDSARLSVSRSPTQQGNLPRLQGKQLRPRVSRQHSGIRCSGWDTFSLRTVADEPQCSSSNNRLQIVAPTGGVREGGLLETAGTHCRLPTGRAQDSRQNDSAEAFRD